jgi:hypothetical protein
MLKKVLRLLKWRREGVSSGSTAKLYVESVHIALLLSVRLIIQRRRSEILWFRQSKDSMTAQKVLHTLYAG